MFEKIKRNLFKFFKSSWYGESKNKNKDETEIGLDLISENEEKVFVEQKVIDPRERARKKFQMIAKRTKSWRIREKNIKRLVDYYD